MVVVVLRNDGWFDFRRVAGLVLRVWVLGLAWDLRASSAAANVCLAGAVGFWNLWNCSTL